MITLLLKFPDLDFCLNILFKESLSINSSPIHEKWNKVLPQWKKNHCILVLNSCLVKMAAVGETAFSKKISLSGKISWLLWRGTCFDLVPSFQYILKVHDTRSAGVKPCHWLVWFYTKPQLTKELFGTWSHLSTLKHALKNVGKSVLWNGRDTKAWRKSSYSAQKLFRSTPVTAHDLKELQQLKEWLHGHSVTLCACILSIILPTTK